MDNTTTAAIQKAYSLIKAGDPREARAILVPLVKDNPDIADAWYLLGFTVTDPTKRLYAFQQVLRIDPANAAALKQVAKLQVPPPTPVLEQFAKPQSPAPAPTPVQPYFTQSPVPAYLPKPAAPKSVPPYYTPQDRQGTRETAQPSNETGRQPSTRKRTFPFMLVFALVGGLALVGATLFYIGNGVNLNKQVNELFSQRKCSEVVSSGTFANAYPRVLFSSVFGVYTQVAECQAWLSADHAFQNKDWSGTFIVARDYLANYPEGAFAKEMHQHLGDSILSWSKDLQAKNDYAAAIEKLKLLQTTDPTSAAGPTVVDNELEDYILWAKTLGEQKDYQTAEKYLTQVRSDARIAAARLQEASQGLAVVYLQWGMSQVQSGDFDKGLKHLAAARQLDSSLADYDRINDQANLRFADALAGANDFDGALAKIKAVSDTSQSEDSKSEATSAQAKIIDAYAHSNSAQAQAQIAAAAAKVCVKQTPDLPLFGMDTQTLGFVLVSPFNLQLTEDWLAKTPAELHYVVCNTEKEVTINNCGYEWGYVVRRKRYYWNLQMYDISTGKSVHSGQLAGSNPRPCASTEYFSGGVKDIYGNRPTIDQIINWLKALAIKH